MIFLKFHGTAPWNNILSSATLSGNINPVSGEMRVNVKVYYKQTNSTNVTSAVLLPTPNDLANNILKAIPVPTNNPSINLLFFGKANFEADEFDVWHGLLRNVLIFNEFLSDDQLTNLFNKGIKTYYDWLELGEYDVIKSITSDSSIGCTYVYNTDNLNVYDCQFKSQISALS